jgi:hypothetical protein
MNKFVLESVKYRNFTKTYEDNMLGSGDELFEDKFLQPIRNNIQKIHFENYHLDYQINEINDIEQKKISSSSQNNLNQLLNIELSKTSQLNNMYRNAVGQSYLNEFNFYDRLIQITKYIMKKYKFDDKDIQKYFTGYNETYEDYILNTFTNTYLSKNPEDELKQVVYIDYSLDPNVINYMKSYIAYILSFIKKLAKGGRIMFYMFLAVQVPDIYKLFLLLPCFFKEVTIMYPLNMTTFRNKVFVVCNNKINDIDTEIDTNKSYEIVIKNIEDTSDVSDKLYLFQIELMKHVNYIHELLIYLKKIENDKIKYLVIKNKIMTHLEIYDI